MAQYHGRTGPSAGGLSFPPRVMPFRPLFSPPQHVIHWVCDARKLRGLRGFKLDCTINGTFDRHAIIRESTRHNL
jgi:hypothetical protein